MKNFTKKIDEFVKKNQYERKKFAVDLFPALGQFPVNKGDIIALSGNSGSSDGPHLHFEFRDAKTSNPLNPLFFNFNIQDNIKPGIVNVIIYPFNEFSFIDNKNEKKIIPVTGNNGNYNINSNNIIQVYGKIGIGIETVDYLNNTRNKFDVYSIELLVDNITFYYHELNEFSFSETRYINSHIDYEEYIKSKRKIHKTFVEPNNKLSIYKNLKNRGIIEFKDKNIHIVSLIVKDFYQNTSILNFKIQSYLNNYVNAILSGNSNYSKIMPYQYSNSFEKDDIKINLPKDALYDTLYFEYAKTESIKEGFSKVHHVHNQYTPIHKSYTLSIKPDNLPEHLRNKSLIASIGNEKDELISIGGEWQDDFVTVKTRKFGKFVVVIDTISPEIIPLNIGNKKDLSYFKSIEFKVTDDLSGIKSYNGYIDKQWVLFEYDSKNDKIFYVFDEDRLINGNNHELELYIIDNKNNAAVYHIEFFR